MFHWHHSWTWVAHKLVSPSRMWIRFILLLITNVAFQRQSQKLPGPQFDKSYPIVSYPITTIDAASDDQKDTNEEHWCRACDHQKKHETFCSRKDRDTVCSTTFTPFAPEMPPFISTRLLQDWSTFLWSWSWKLTLVITTTSKRESWTSPNWSARPRSWPVIATSGKWAVYSLWSNDCYNFSFRMSGRASHLQNPIHTPYHVCSYVCPFPFIFQFEIRTRNSNLHWKKEKWDVWQAHHGGAYEFG